MTTFPLDNDNVSHGKTKLPSNNEDLCTGPECGNDGLPYHRAVSLFEPIPLVVEEDSYDCALEWSRLLELVASFVHSAVAREWLLALKPSRDSSWIAAEHALVEEMRLLLREGVEPPSRGLFDPSSWPPRRIFPGLVSSRKRSATCCLD